MLNHPRLPIRDLGNMTKLLDHLRQWQFRGKVRLWNSVTPITGTRVAKVFGADLELDLTNHVDRTIYMGCYEPLNTSLFKRILNPGETVVDVGANIGYFSLLAAKLVGNAGKVIAVEAHPRNFEVLSAAVQRNGLKQVVPVNIGLSDENGSAQIIMADQDEFANRTASMVPQPGLSGPTVPVRRLDDCISSWNIDVIDLLKIDVDGFETKIIRGATKLLSSGRVRNVIMEFDDHWLSASGSSAEELTGLLQAAGFSIARHPIAAFLLGPLGDRHFVRANHAKFTR
jgi:FkbM family methyltransferase